MSVDGSGQTVKSETVDSGRKVHALLERLDGTGGSTAGGTQRSLGVVNRETELGLGTLVGVRGGLAAGKVKRNLGLLGEFLGKVFEELQTC